MSHSISRRRFLGQVNCAAISSLPILSTLLNLKLAGDVSAASTSGDHRALVCLFLSGGIDSFNLLVPAGDAEYAEYKATRGGVALPKTDLRPISPLNNTGVQLGLHPAFEGLQSLFAARKASFVANVGTLIQPVTKDDYDNDNAPLPVNLYSHSDQTEQWHTSMPHTRSSKGWAGRAADIVRSLNTQDTVSMNISLSGTNIWQSGEFAYEYTVNTDGAVPLDGYDATNTNAGDPVAIRTRAVDSQIAFQYQHLLQQAFVDKKRTAMDAFSMFNDAISGDLAGGIVFPDTYIGDQLKMVAKAIIGHDKLKQRRQTFFVEYGGWDTHDGLIATQAQQLPEIDQAVKAFYDTLAAHGMADDVTLFTASDFGRTLTTDSAGTDHAWGGNHFVVGGAVSGRRVLGQYPSLVLDSAIDVGRGRLIPQVSVDSYFADLALWLGVPKSSLRDVFPNIGNFYDPQGGGTPLGIFG